ncbi:hypothetical protein [Pseudonocardia sp. ICBG162]|uniref:hypothetical protein n=1 Tax=Pseudonocardia sp. ICBG162 TaxID=2846761 RepID=UPI001CF6171A|nr:hypothetical protein [Pseudonocardia sp. ICBG162]
MAIVRCALAIIQKRGSETTPPTQIADLTTQEQSFLDRHVSELRRSARKEGAIRARFRDDSELEDQFRTLRDTSSAENLFLETCSFLVSALADAMKLTTRAEDCVVAIVTSNEVNSEERHSTLLKLDAEIEGANLSAQPDGSIRLEVFEHLLPAPGKLQKGLSWPDPRDDSELILLDTNRTAAAQYFQNAFAIEASPRPIDAEKALTDAIQKLDAPRAIEAA